MNQQEIKQRLLDSAYAENKGGPVAYIDESYVAPSMEFPGVPFYVVTAYVVADYELADDLRFDLPGIVGGDYWHSTQSNRTAEGRDDIQRFCSYVGKGEEPVLVTIKQPIGAEDPTAETARSECLTKMLCALSEGTGGYLVRLVVFEERKFTKQRNADQRTVTLARRAELIPRNMKVFPTSPSIEKLLWLPDIVSYALYSAYAGGTRKYAEPFIERIKFIELDGLDG